MVEKQPLPELGRFGAPDLMSGSWPAPSQQSSVARLVQIRNIIQGLLFQNYP